MNTSNNILTNQTISNYEFKENVNIYNLKIIQKYLCEIIKKFPKDKIDKLLKNVIINGTQKKANEYDYQKNLETKLKTMFKDYNLSKQSNYGLVEFIKTYKYPIKSFKDYEGRLYVNGVGLQNLPREIRWCLMDANSLDIDIENCHPVILSQFCKKNNIISPYLFDYVNDRDNIINQIINDNPEFDKGKVKNYILSSLNGGDKNKYKINNDFYNNLVQEFEDIRNSIVKLDDYIELYKYYKKHKSFNPKGSVLAYILDTIESDILINAINFNIDKDILTETLNFDGFTISSYSKNKIDDDYFSNLSLYVFDKTSYNVKYISKPFEDVLNFNEFINKYNVDKENSHIDIDIIDKDLCFDFLKDKYELNENNREYRIHKFTNILKNYIEHTTDFDGAELIKYCYKKSLFSIKKDKKKSFIYCNKNNIWIEDDDILDSLISYEILPFFYKLSSSLNKKISQYSNEIGSAQKELFNTFSTNLFKSIKLLKTSTKVNNICNKSLILLYNEEMFNKLDTNFNILPFKNCCIDFEKCISRPIEKQDYVSMFINYDYNDKYGINKNEKNIINEVDNFLKSLFQDIEKYEYLKNVLSRCLCRNDSGTEFVICYGNGSNGKSLLLKLLINTFRSFIQRFNKATITENNTNAMAFNQLIEGKNKCIGYIADADCKKAMNAEIIKEYGDTRGDKEVNNRGMWEKNSYYKQTIKFIVNCNDLPSNSNNDGGVKRRLKLFNFDRKFVDKYEYDRDHYIDSTLRIKDDTLDAKFENIEYCYAFLNILINTFFNNKINNTLVMRAPQTIENDVNQYYKENNAIIPFLEKYYHFTHNDEDFVSSPDIFDQIRKDYSWRYSEMKDVKSCISLSRSYLSKVKCIYSKKKNDIRGYIRLKLKSEEEIINS